MHRTRSAGRVKWPCPCVTHALRVKVGSDATTATTRGGVAEYPATRVCTHLHGRDVTVTHTHDTHTHTHTYTHSLTHTHAHPHTHTHTHTTHTHTHTHTHIDTHDRTSAKHSGCAHSSRRDSGPSRASRAPPARQQRSNQSTFQRRGRRGPAAPKEAGRAC